ncbi:MAG: hypothetical protein CK523_03485 [Actinobacteria bacterium]|nr:MAG: hypothetical protein CK523_03485 [Actinomycetota bacterium]
MRNIHLLLRPLAIACLAWNACVVGAVVVNSSFALTRAAGGHYTSFPLGVRMTYVGMEVIVLLQIWTLIEIWRRKAINPPWLPRIFLVMNLCATFANTISSSQNERWNAIPALIAAWAFWLYAPTKGGKP